jgi:hypothetical protein
MAKKFACLSPSGDEINVFNGATGEIVVSKSLPDNVAASYFIDISYDGAYVAVTAPLKDYVWFLATESGNTSRVSTSGLSSGGRGFDGNGTFYVGGSLAYLKIAPPYGFAVPVNTSPVSLTLFPSQIPEQSVAVQRIPSTGATSYVRLDLTTGRIGAPIAYPNETGPIRVNSDSTNAMTWFSGNYGVRFWDYSTGNPLSQTGPTAGAQANEFRSGFGLTSDGQKYVIKTSDNTIGIGDFGSAPRQVSLDAVTEYSADNAYTFLEGMLDDNTVLLSSATIRNMLVAFSLVSAQVVWQNSSGYNAWSGAGDAKSLGVQPTAGPVDPPASTGFWKDLLLAYETP